MKIRLTTLTAVALGLACLACGRLAAQPITINAHGNLNDHADQVGIWVNTNADTYSRGYVDQLRRLNVRSIRHGWQYSTMAAGDPNTFAMSPCDPKVQGYISDGRCHLVERMKLSEVALVAQALGVPGYAVLGMDGINYTGNADAGLARMPKAQREAFYIANAQRWARWAKNNNFEYFELGNENDLPGEMVDQGVGRPWTPQAYGAYARRMAKAIKAIYPAAKCGINGGWGNTAAKRNAWWDGILEGAPDINKYIDFVVLHKYEFGQYYDSWSQNLWDWGRIQADNFRRIKANFPGKPVHVTETSGFQKENGIVPHYRGVMTVEMMGNMLMDRQVETIQHWGTRWGDDLVFDRNSNAFNMMGNALEAYTKFMKKRLVDNGTAGSIRYFAAKNPADNSLTVWLVNHATTRQTANVRIDHFAAAATGQLWRLTSPGNNAFAANNTLRQDGHVSAPNGAFSVACSPTSVTVATFGAKNSASKPLDRTGWVATAYSTFQGFATRSMIDNNPKSRWTSGASMDGGSWVQLDMRAPQTVNRIRVASQHNNYPNAARIYVSNTPGRGGKLVARINNANSPIADYRFANAKGRYIRIVAAKAKPDWWDILDMAVYGPASGRLAEARPPTGIALYPNPAKNQVALGGVAFATVKIYDSYGKLAMETTAGPARPIQVGRLGAGVYHVWVTDENNNTHVLRLVKE